jgi:hypothetical protein
MPGIHAREARGRKGGKIEKAHGKNYNLARSIKCRSRRLALLSVQEMVIIMSGKGEAGARTAPGS